MKNLIYILFIFLFLSVGSNAGAQDISAATKSDTTYHRKKANGKLKIMPSRKADLYIVKFYEGNDLSYPSHTIVTPRLILF